ncbi:hypothetical protein DMC30DRAFT_422035 [Rhodotorula diobovata]|uniref:EF-hand domain-containing protein n=1 Tax=Rhodotorula diobovata TaxID=5288 RepID=A0A5C5FUK1_9BASI|nr:hypothetical protein DMC30DRAFT_422035 [Rhodotorula diobovata]
MSTSTLGLGRPQTGKASTTHPRQSSGAYQLFDAAQVQTFREAFNLIDQDNDGVISESDLRGLLNSLGQHPDPTLLHSLLHARPAPSSSSSAPSPPHSAAGPLNFTSFVTLLASHLAPLDPEPDMLEAFACFDENNCGTCDAGEVRAWLKRTGDRMSDEEVDKLLHPPFLDRKTNQFNYRLFCQTLRIADPPGEADAAAGAP